jgi:peroxiredoxin
MKWRSLAETAGLDQPRSLSEVFSERKALIARYVPPEVQKVHTSVVSELKQAGIGERALQPGMQSPGFELSDHTGKLLRSRDLLDKGPFVISFFRGRWCPFCVGQLEALNAIHPKLQEAGASLVAISPQNVHQSYLMADQHRLQFPLLSDAGNNIARQFGLVYRVPEYQQEIYQRAFVNLPFVNGDPSWELPIPATYVLDPEGRILYAAPNPDYTERPEPAEILRFLSQRPAD